MTNNWIRLSIITLFLITIFGLSIQYLILNNKDNINLLLIYIRFILIISAIISLFTFIIPPFNLNKNDFMVIKKNINLFLLISSSIILIFYQILVFYCFIKAGPICSVIILISLPILIIMSSLFLNYEVQIWIWIPLIIYVLLGLLIGIYKYFLDLTN